MVLKTSDLFACDLIWSIYNDDYMFCMWWTVLYQRRWWKIWVNTIWILAKNDELKEFSLDVLDPLVNLELLMPKDR